MMLSNILNSGNILFQEGLIGFLIGIMIVFLGICILVLVISLVGKVINAKSTEKTEKVEVVQPQVVEKKPDTDEIPDHVKVAIMAAVMAYFEQQNEKCEFTVRKIVRRR